MDHVVDRNGYLHSDCGVVLLEAEVVILDVGVLGETAVLSLEGDLRPPEIAVFTEGGLAFGACDGVGRVDCRAGGRGRSGDVRRDGGKRWNAVPGGAECPRRKTDEACKMSLVGDGLIFGTEASEADLCGGEAGCGEI